MDTGRLRLAFYSFRVGERSAQVCTAIGAKLDAAGQLLAAAVAKFGTFLLGDVNAGSVTIRGVTVVMHDEGTINVTAHGKALGAHDLTVVNHELLL